MKKIVCNILKQKEVYRNFKTEKVEILKLQKAEILKLKKVGILKPKKIGILKLKKLGILKRKRGFAIIIFEKLEAFQNDE